MAPSRKARTVFEIDERMRLMVWKASLPAGRAMNIDDTLYDLRQYRNGGRSPFPVTLKVNRESQRETVRHYEIFHPEDFPSKAKNSRNVYGADPSASVQLVFTSSGGRAA